MDKEKTSWQSHLYNVDRWHPTVVVVVVLGKLWRKEEDDRYEKTGGRGNHTATFFNEREDVSALV